MADAVSCKNEYRIFKPAEITVRRGQGRKEKNRGMNQLGLQYICTWKCYNENK
jgi:hypothetical protein